MMISRGSQLMKVRKVHLLRPIPDLKLGKLSEYLYNCAKGRATKVPSLENKGWYENTYTSNYKFQASYLKHKSFFSLFTQLTVLELK